MILNRVLRLLSFFFGCEGVGSGSYNLGIKLFVSRSSGYGAFQALGCKSGEGALVQKLVNKIKKIR